MRNASHRTLAALAALAFLALAPPAAAAQEPAPAPAADSAPPDAVQAEWLALKQEFEAAQKAFYAKFAELASDEERAKLWQDPAQNPNRVFAARYRAFAEKSGAHPAAAEAWMWLLQTAEDGAAAGAIVDRMLKDFLHAPAIAQLAAFLTYAEWSLGRPRTLEALRAIRRDTRHAEGRLEATLTLGIVLMRAAEEAERAEGRALLEEVVRTAAGTPRAAQAEGYLYELDHLQIGMVAPEIEGEDSEGRPFRLSDYRGRVVVLDFWGFW